MKLKQISTFFIIGIVLANVLASCDGSDSESISSSASADAQIYSFSAKSIPRTKADTANYPYLTKARFAIDQTNRVIYNVDSLPYGFTVRKIAASITFSTSTPNATQVVYPEDSIVDWTAATDSVDFTIFPKKENTQTPQIKFKVTAQNGTAPYDYTIKLLIHQVDPDEILWKREADLLIGCEQTKTLAINDSLYHLERIGNQLGLSQTKVDDVSWFKNFDVILPAAAKLEGIAYLKKKIYLTDAGNTLYSLERVSNLWSINIESSNTVVNILGRVNDSGTEKGIVLKNSGSDVVLATTEDFQSYQEFEKINDNKRLEGFPVEGYSVVFDKKNNMLLVTGGKKIDGTWSNSTWWITFQNGAIQVIEVSKSIPFEATEGLVSFLYDDKLFVWAKEKDEAYFKLYSSDKGTFWIEAPEKQYFDEDADVVTGQSIVVDSNNYIWVLGGRINNTLISQQVWRGRMNKMDFKIK